MVVSSNNNFIFDTLCFLNIFYIIINLKKIVNNWLRYIYINTNDSNIMIMKVIFNLLEVQFVQ